jgi:hypothetical protein
VDPPDIKKYVKLPTPTTTIKKPAPAAINGRSMFEEGGSGVATTGRATGIGLAGTGNGA